MFTYLSGSHSFTENDNAKIIKVISLEDGININTLPKDQMLIEYSAPNATMEIYTSPTATGSNFDMTIGYKTSTEGALSRTIQIEK